MSKCPRKHRFQKRLVIGRLPETGNVVEGRATLELENPIGIVVRRNNPIGEINAGPNIIKLSESVLET